MPQHSDEWAVQGIEVADDAVIVVYMRLPRVLPTGDPVIETRTITAPRGVDLDVLLDDFVFTINDLGADLRRAVDDGNTLSLEEWDAEREDDEDSDLGLGDGNAHG